MSSIAGEQWLQFDGAAYGERLQRDSDLPLQAQHCL